MSAGGASREKVVILGGGMAAMSAAFALSRPGWRDRFESITVYQVGWRLGGKGASGRGRNGRIQEHGLHLWLGFYENAFRVLRECYEELGRPAGAPLARLDDALKKSSFVVLEEWHDGQWKHWPIDYPEDDRVPGVPDAGDGPFGILEYVKRAIALMERLSRDAGLPVEAPPTDLATSLSGGGFLDRLAGDVVARLRGVGSAALSTARSLAARLGHDASALGAAHQGALLELVELHLGWARGRVPGGDRARRLWALVEIVGAIVLGILRGIARDGLLARGFSALDRYDFIEWLRDNGAPAEAVRSPVLIGGYDLAFAFRDGDPSQPALAAGQALRSTMRLFFTYKGAMFWKMEAGMGDVVFTPLYQVLKRRGVEFRFFHRVRSLRLSADRRAIGAVEMGRQVDLADGIHEYDPLVDVAGLPCWPAEPRAEQIRNGDALRGHDLESLWDPWPDAGTVTLRAGTDYDRLVFGISLGAVPYLCRELIEDNPRWRDMVAHVRTVATQAFQLWLGPDAAGLGWTMGQANLSGWVEPFDTYADMRQLIPREPWPAGSEPGSIAYFCNAMPTGPAGRAAPDPAFAAESAAEVKRGAIAFLRRQARHLWPRAIDPATGDFRWDLLVDDEGRTGVDRFDSQFWRANVDPSEHYVQSVPGSDRYRIKTDETGYDNLYVVGDWIDCGFNTGCVEAAVMSGLLASHAISGSPRREDIVGYGHP